MKNLMFAFIFAFALFLAGCNGKLPNASITGATPWDYVPYCMMGLGALFLAYTGLDYAENHTAYSDKTKNPAQKWFVFGVGGLILLIMGFVLYAS